MDVRTLPTIFRSKRGDNDKRRGEVESIKSAHRRESVKVPGFLKVNGMEIPMRGEGRREEEAEITNHPVVHREDLNFSPKFMGDKL